MGAKDSLGGSTDDSAAYNSAGSMDGAGGASYYGGSAGGLYDLPCGDDYAEGRGGDSDSGLSAAKGSGGGGSAGGSAHAAWHGRSRSVPRVLLKAQSMYFTRMAGGGGVSSPLVDSHGGAESHSTTIKGEQHRRQQLLHQRGGSDNSDRSGGGHEHRTQSLRLLSASASFTTATSTSYYSPAPHASFAYESTNAVIVGDVLRSIPLFASLDDTERSLVAASLVTLQCADHDVVAQGPSLTSPLSSPTYRTPSSHEGGLCSSSVLGRRAGEEVLGRSVSRSHPLTARAATVDAVVIVLDGSVALLRPLHAAPTTTTTTTDRLARHHGEEEGGPGPQFFHRGQFFIPDGLPPGTVAVARGAAVVAVLRATRLSALLHWFADSRSLGLVAATAAAATPKLPLVPLFSAAATTAQAVVVAENGGVGGGGAARFGGGAAVGKLQSGLTAATNRQSFVAALRRYKDRAHNLPLSGVRAHDAKSLGRELEQAFRDLLREQ